MTANLKVFDLDSVEAVITDCTSCGMMMKEKFSKLLDADDPLQEKAQALAGKIFEVTDFLQQKACLKLLLPWIKPLPIMCPAIGAGRQPLRMLPAICWDPCLERNYGNWKSRNAVAGRLAPFHAATGIVGKHPVPSPGAD